MHDNETIIQELLKVGARGYLLKTDARRHLIGAIEALAAHKPFFTAKVSDALPDTVLSHPARERSALTYRERGVVQLGFRCFVRPECSCAGSATLARDCNGWTRARPSRWLRGADFRNKYANSGNKALHGTLSIERDSLRRSRLLG
jgi:hypothetical protein